MALLLLTTLALSGLRPDPAEASEWFKPAAADWRGDLLTVPYDAQPGRGDSIHATCSADLTGVELGVHPFDGVARNFQVWDADQLVLNVNSADHTQVFPFGDLAIVYSGERHEIVPPASQVETCETATVTAPPVQGPPQGEPPEATPGVPPLEVTGTTAAGDDSLPDVPPGESVTTIAGVGGVCAEPCAGVLTSSQRRLELPATGGFQLIVAVIGGILAISGVASVITGRWLRRISPHYPEVNDYLDNEDTNGGRS